MGRSVRRLLLADRGCRSLASRLSKAGILNLMNINERHWFIELVIRITERLIKMRYRPRIFRPTVRSKADNSHLNLPHFKISEVREADRKPWSQFKPGMKERGVKEEMENKTKVNLYFFLQKCIS